MTRSSKRKTKKEELIQMLTRKAGADVAMISNKLGWQTHTTRAALTGLRKAGYEVLGEKPACPLSDNLGRLSVFRLEALAHP